MAHQPLGDDARHFVRCPKGLRLHSIVSDRVRDELAYILERCNIRIPSSVFRIIAEWAVHAELRQAAAEPEDEDDEDDEGESEGEDEDE